MAIRSLKSGSFSRSTQVGNSIILPGDYESIATVTVGAGGSSSITFSSIPSTFTHLQIRLTGRSTNASNEETVYMRFNGDTASNYSGHILAGDGATASAAGTANLTEMYAGRIASASATSGIFGVAVMDILDYANTNKYKTMRSLAGVDRNGAGLLRFNSGNWRSTSAITSVTLWHGADFAQYTHAALYGIRG